MNSKQCPDLVEWIESTILLCKKGDDPYVPQLNELKRYCKSSNFCNCPFYVKFDQAISPSGIINTHPEEDKVVFARPGGIF